MNARKKHWNLQKNHIHSDFWSFFEVIRYFSCYSCCWCCYYCDAAVLGWRRRNEKKISEKNVNPPVLSQKISFFYNWHHHNEFRENISAHNFFTSSVRFISFCVHSFLRSSGIILESIRLAKERNGKMGIIVRNGFSWKNIWFVNWIFGRSTISLLLWRKEKHSVAEGLIV